MYGTLKQLTDHWIKGKGETVNSILDCMGSKGEEVCLKCGEWELLVTRLAPGDYHRFHAPLTGKVLSVKHILGDSLSVDPRIVNSTAPVYSRNQRVVVHIRPDNDIYHHAYVVIVGATCVDSIRLSHESLYGAASSELRKKSSLWDQDYVKKASDANVLKGEELGSFHYGGSTILTLLSPYENKTKTQTTAHVFADVNNVRHAEDNSKCNACTQKSKKCATVCVTELSTEVGVPIIRKITYM